MYFSFCIFAELLAKVAKDRFGALDTEYQKVTCRVFFIDLFVDFLTGCSSFCLSLLYDVNERGNTLTACGSQAEAVFSVTPRTEKKCFWLAAPPVNPQFSSSVIAADVSSVWMCVSLPGSDVHAARRFFRFSSLCVSVFCGFCSSFDAASPLLYVCFVIVFFHLFIFRMHALSIWSGLLWPPPAREHCADPPGKTLHTGPAAPQSSLLSPCLINRP